VALVTIGPATSPRRTELPNLNTPIITDPKSASAHKAGRGALRGLALITRGGASSVGARISVRRFRAVFVLLVTGIWVAQAGRFGAVTACLEPGKYP